MNNLSQHYEAPASVDLGKDELRGYGLTGIKLELVSNLITAINHKEKS